MTALLVTLGGAIGAVLRFVVDGEIKHRRHTAWPVGTFLINVTGSFVLGMLLGAGLPEWSTALFATGVCGGFTTFSTASVETVNLIRSRAIGTAVLYTLGTLMVCWAVCWIGDAFVS